MLNILQYVEYFNNVYCHLLPFQLQIMSSKSNFASIGFS